MIQFLNCKIDISKKVFIPREETEYWAKIAIKDIQKKELQQKNQLKVLDIFAGTGCLGIAVLKNTKNTFVDFVDIDKEALDQILINLKINQISQKRYQIIQSNIFSKLQEKKYDFILANPPYVALERIKEVDREVLEKEPHLALMGGRKGMKYIRKFLKKAKEHLKKGGKIYLEFDPLQVEEIRKILIKKGYQFQFCKDQFNKLRFVIAQ